MTDSITYPREFLAASLKRRVPTYDVARAVLWLGGPQAVYPPGVREELESLARWRPTWRNPDDFDRVVPAVRQVRTFGVLFHQTVYEVRAGEPNYLRELVRDGLEQIDAVHDVGIEDGDSAEHALQSHVHDRRFTAYDRKRLRFLARLERKAATVGDMHRLRRAQMQAKSRLAYAIDPDECDDLTLAFCAYLAARANQRSVFMVGPQTRAVDSIVKGLLAMMQAQTVRGWSQAALVMPTVRVLKRLTAEQRGQLIGKFHGAMTDAAEALDGLYDTLPSRMRAEMVMVQGVDSSRWNAYAGALNTMRDAWKATLVASDQWAALDSYLPGKAPRLMAADVAWMNRSLGKDLHPDTTMFSALPRPWDVIFGRATLNRERVLEVAQRQGVDATATGWVGPRAPQAAERPAPEPALVHGVVIEDPRLAANLRRCGAFSGKELRYLDELPEVRRGVRMEGERMIPTVEGQPTSEKTGRP